MTIGVTPLTPCFAARIDGVDVSRPVDDATWADIRGAFDEHSVLVFPRQSLRLMQRTTISGDPAEVALR